jgi:hypothetical protein
MTAAELEVIIAMAKLEQHRERIKQRAQAALAMVFVIVCFAAFVVAMIDILVWRN